MGGRVSGAKDEGGGDGREPRGRRLLVALICAACVALSLWLLRPSPEPSGIPGERRSATAGSSPPPEAPTAAEGAAAPRARAEIPVDEAALSRFGVPPASRAPVGGSLRGTEVDGGIEVDAEGRFLPSRSALLLFDYFLSLSGEEPVEVIRGRIVLHILQTTPADAAEEAIEALDRYLAMRKAARELVASGHAPSGMERRLQWIRELRREHLGPELNEAFYGEEERTAVVDLERRRVMLDEDLDPEERAARIAALEEELPERVREARERASAPARTRQQVEQLRNEGASEREIFELREREFGPEAAERLAEHDRRQAAWERSLANFKRERVEILADESLSEKEQRAAIEALLAERFAEQERARARTLAEADDPRH